MRSAVPRVRTPGQLCEQHALLLAAHSLACCRDGTTKILISTDVLSRGFDVTQARRAREERHLLALLMHAAAACRVDRRAAFVTAAGWHVVRTSCCSTRAVACQCRHCCCRPSSRCRCDAPSRCQGSSASCRHRLAHAATNRTLPPLMQVTLVINFDVPVERDLQARMSSSTTGVCYHCCCCVGCGQAPGGPISGCALLGGLAVHSPARCCGTCTPA